MLRPSLVIASPLSTVALTASPCWPRRPRKVRPPRSACASMPSRPIRFRGTSTSAFTSNGSRSCRQAMTTDAGDIRIRKAMARAFGASGQRVEEIVLLCELAARNDADALCEIYDMYKSYFRSDVNKPQLVKRAEAEQALRKAAELGHAYATLMLAVLLDRGDTVKRDNADAIRWAERAVTNPSKDTRPIEMQVLLGRLLVKSDNWAEKARGIALLEKLAQAGPINAKTQFAIAIHASDPVRVKAGLRTPSAQFRCSAAGELPMCRASRAHSACFISRANWCPAI